MFCLVDCNNFYASCERVFRPDLNGQPVVVLSNNDGCVIARSNEAKAVGVPMGAPAYQNRDLFEKYHVAVFSSNFTLYGDMSNRVMNILESYSPKFEQYSIDEAFLDFGNTDTIDLDELGQTIRNHVLQWTGIPVSVGFAPTKVLAKTANHIAKKFTQRTGGVYVIDTDEKRLKALKWLKINDVWGIGRNYSKRLLNLGIETAWDFSLLSDVWVNKHMSVVGLRLKQELLGHSVIEIDEIQPHKTISTTRTFDQNYATFEQIREAVVNFTVNCAEKLRAQHSGCRSIMIFIQTNTFRADLPQYRETSLIKLPFATNSDLELVQYAVAGLKQIFRQGYAYKRAGVILMEISSDENRQLTLFDERNLKHILLMKTIDKVNYMMGSGTIHLSSQSTKRRWKMHQEKLSPNYTTKLSDVIVIKS